MKIPNPLKRDKKEIIKKHLPEHGKNEENKTGRSLLVDPRNLDPLQQVPIEVDTIRLLTNEGNTNRLSKITKDEMDEIYELNMFNTLFMEDSEAGKLAVSTRLNMFCSVGGWNIEQLTGMMRRDQNISVSGEPK